jgi:hypothetical protein
LKVIHRKSFLLFVFALSLLVPTLTKAQDDSTPKKRLRSPATVRGFIGGESHDSYVIRARRGKTMTVRISWRPEEDNSAGFSVSRSSSFFSAEPLAGGTESADGKRWTGKIPATGNYYIYVTAHPTAHYTLRMVVR